MWIMMLGCMESKQKELTDHHADHLIAS